MKSPTPLQPLKVPHTNYHSLKNTISSRWVSSLRGLAPINSITRTLRVLNNTAVQSKPPASTNSPSRTLQPFLYSSSLSPPTHAMCLSHPIITRAKSGIFKPKVLVVNFKLTSLFFEPSSPASSLLCPQWKSAMEDEIAALIKIHTWFLVPP